MFLFCVYIRDRPFNLQGEAMVFFSFRNFFSDNTRVSIFSFFVAQSANFSSQYITLGYMTKTLNQIFFSSTKIRIFFQQHSESEYFFRKKTITHKLIFKYINVDSYSYSCYMVALSIIVGTVVGMIVL